VTKAMGMDVFMVFSFRMDRTNANLLIATPAINHHKMI